MNRLREEEEKKKRKKRRKVWICMEYGSLCLCDFEYGSYDNFVWVVWNYLCMELGLCMETWIFLWNSMICMDSYGICMDSYRICMDF